MNVLISSAGRRNYIVEYFQDCLQTGGDVISVNSIENTAAMFCSSRSLVAPPISSGEYVPFLLDSCKKYDTRLLLSLFDQDLMKISMAKDEFRKEDISVAISDKKVIETAFDKVQFATFLNNLNLESPTIYQIDSMETESSIQFPIMIKPRWGTGSIATQIVEDEEELSFFIDYFKRKINNSYLKEIPGLELSNEIILQPFIQGDEYHLDVVNDLKGNYLVTFPKKKLSMREGETEVAITLKDEVLESIGQKIGSNLNHVGILDVDIIKSEVDQYYIIDANPRFGGGYPFSHNAGANVPAAILSWAKNEEHDPEWLKIEPNIISAKGINVIRKGN